jgi:ribosomal protein S27AE
MAVVDNVLHVLDRVPIWKRLQGIPGEVDELKKKIAELESSLARCPADGCPYCGARAFRLKLQAMHGKLERWECGECKQTADLRLDLLTPAAMKGSPIWGARK